MPPTFQAHSSSVEVEVNKTLMLSVTIGYNYPLSGISWIFNGNSLIRQSRVSVTIPPVFEVPSVTTSLQINSVIPRDAGVYVVMVTSPAGDVNSSITVDVTGRIIVVVYSSLCMCTHNIIIYTYIIYTISLFPFVAVATIIQPTGASSSLEYDIKYLVLILVS